MTRAIVVGGLWALVWAVALAWRAEAPHVALSTYGVIAPLCLVGALLGSWLPTAGLRAAPLRGTLTWTATFLILWAGAFATHHFLLTHSFDLLEEVAAFFAGALLATTLLGAGLVGWWTRHVHRPSKRWAALPPAVLATLGALTASLVTPPILGFEAVVAGAVVVTSGCVVFAWRALNLGSAETRWERLCAAAILLASAGGLTMYATSDATRDDVWRHEAMSRSLMRGIVRVADGDGDGVSGAMGHPDCHPDDARRFPGARERPGDGVDDNCLGGDAPLEAVAALWRDGGARARTRADLPFTRAPHHILLITVDAARADALSLYDCPRPTTPNLKNLGELALVFEQAWSASNYTATSLFSLMTGLYPSAFLDGVAVGARPGLTLAEQLVAAGWSTEAIVDLHPSLPHLYAGFQAVDESLGARAAGAVRNRSTGSTATEITALGVAALDRLGQRETPGMLWLHYSEPHAAYLSHPGYETEEDDRSRYEGEIAFTDAAIGRLLAHARDTGRLKDTIIVITSDHGEAFGEHGVWTHGQSLFEEELHVPLVIYLPNARGDGFKAARVTAPVDLTDVTPTLLDAVGVSPNSPTHGESLLAHALTGRPLKTPEVFAEVRLPYARIQAWRQGDDKWLFNHLTGHVSRFDLRADPGEQDPLEPTPESLQRVSRWIDLHLALPAISAP